MTPPAQFSFAPDLSVTTTPVSAHRPLPPRMPPDQLIQSHVPCPTLHFALVFFTVFLFWQYIKWLSGAFPTMPALAGRNFVFLIYHCAFKCLEGSLAQRRILRKFVQWMKMAPKSHVSSLPTVTPKPSPSETYRGPKGNTDGEASAKWDGLKAQERFCAGEEKPEGSIQRVRWGENTYQPQHPQQRSGNQ